MKYTKRIAAILLSAMLLLTGCGPSAKGAVTVDKVSFPLEDYKASYLYSQWVLNTQLSMYGIPSDAFMQTEDDRATYHQQIADMATQQLTLLGIFEDHMKKEKLHLNEKLLDEAMAAQATQMGGEELMKDFIGQMGLTMEQYRHFASMDTMIHQLRGNLFEKDPDAAMPMFKENYMRCKHILIADDEGTPEKEAFAKEIAEKAKSGEDFDSLIQQYNEDPGMSANPDGYVFTEGMMVEPFYEGAKALAENEISDPVRSPFGWHIIQRLPLREQDYDMNAPQVQDAYFSQLVDTWLEEAQVTISDEAKAVTFETLLEEQSAAPEESNPEQESEPEQKPEN